MQAKLCTINSEIEVWKIILKDFQNKKNEKKCTKEAPVPTPKSLEPFLYTKQQNHNKMIVTGINIIQIKSKGKNIK